jgi:hypothetical protein
MPRGCSLIGLRHGRTRLDQRAHYVEHDDTYARRRKHSS